MNAQIPTKNPTFSNQFAPNTSDNRHAPRCQNCGSFRDQTKEFCGHCGAAYTNLFGRSAAAGPTRGELMLSGQGQHHGSDLPENQRTNVMEPLATNATNVHVAPQHSPMPASQVPANQTINVNVSTPQASSYYHGRPAESATFAIITFVLYMMVVPFPVAAMMNLIGLIAGPRRGLFALMFFFILIPSCLLCLAITGFAVLGGFGP